MLPTRDYNTVGSTITFQGFRAYSDFVSGLASNAIRSAAFDKITSEEYDKLKARICLSIMIMEKCELSPVELEELDQSTLTGKAHSALAQSRLFPHPATANTEGLTKFIKSVTSKIGSVAKAVTSMFNSEDKQLQSLSVTVADTPDCEILCLIYDSEVDSKLPNSATRLLELALGWLTRNMEHQSALCVDDIIDQQTRSEMLSIRVTAEANLQHLRAERLEAFKFQICMAETTSPM